jgi:hypothetical protein
VDPDIKKLLEENLKISKENKELLIKVRNFQRWAQITKALYWLMIIGIAFGAFYYLKPMLGNLLNLYSGGVSSVNSIKDVGSNMSEIQDLLKSLNQ